MSANYNQITLIGRVGRDAESRGNDGRRNASFSLAVNRYQGKKDGQEEKTDWFRVTAWENPNAANGGLYGIVMNLAKKGNAVMVSGPVQINEYEAQDGTKRTSVDVVVRDFQILSAKGENGSAGGNGHAQMAGVGAPAGDGGGSIDDEIPF